MPKSPILKVCVIALTYQQHTVVDSRARLLLNTATDSYNVGEKGRIYGDSPDEWHPFEDTKSILEYLREAGFEDSSLSRLIESFDNVENLNALLTDVDLYIFDPLFLTLNNSALQLVDRLQFAIVGSKKAFCILLPDRLPPELSQLLGRLCDQRLYLFKSAYEQGGICEWKAENSLRLKAFLTRLYKHMNALPPQDALGMLVRLLTNAGIPPISLDGSPKLSGD